MSRIANCIKNIPSDINLAIDNSQLKISNPNGTIFIHIDNLVKIDLTNGVLINVNANNASRSDLKKGGAIVGTLSRIIANAIKDISNPFVASINMVGVGFKSSINGNFLHMSIGFSHDIIYKIDDNIKVTIVDNVNIKIFGIDRQKVMQLASKLRNLKQPEPYKGKGLFLNNEKIVKKEVKKK